MALKKRNSIDSNNRKRSRDDDNSNQTTNDKKNHKISLQSNNKSTKVKALLSNLSQGQQLTGYASIILIIAIIVGMIWNINESTSSNNNVDPKISQIWETICQKPGNKYSNVYNAWCGHPLVRPIRRTLQAIRPIRDSETIAEIPRPIQIWELDALTSNFIKQNNLLGARHNVTNNPLPGGAYLAVYLALEQKRLFDITTAAMDDTETQTSNKNDTNMLSNLPQKDQVRATYFQSLPTYDELVESHPILMNRYELRNLLEHHSWNYAVILMYQEMIESEYAAFTNISATFATTILKEEYSTSRVHVLTRSFNPGADACILELEALTAEEKQFIEAQWDVQKGTLFSDGCHAMVPILDMLNHHPNPNVIYKFDTNKAAFIITAKTKTSIGWEIMDSYGKYSDSHLFAKYGFVNGDGSGYTQASIALFHRPLDADLKNEFMMIPIEQNNDGDDNNKPTMDIPEFQKLELKRYLQYDDGYDDCIQKELHPKAFRLKQLKWTHLAKIANHPKAWIVTLSPRSSKSQPVESSHMLITEVPPEINPRNLRMDITSLMDTCRLLALTIYDYDGNAIEVLETNLQNQTFVVERGNIALEYRTLMFMARLASTALLQYKTSLKEELDNVAQLNNNKDFGSKNWTAAHLRLSEMQSLHAVMNTAFGLAKRWEEEARQEQNNGNALYKVRERSCPKEYTEVLYEEHL